jgi:mRNA-decapping enzyme 1B
MDRNVIDIAITATHVVLYEYNNTKQSSWEKKNVEGTLFVTKRSDAPRFKLVVLNRSSTENLEVPITASFQMQVKDPYLIFRDSPVSTDFVGIWFHDGKERDQIASYLEQVVYSLIKIEEMERTEPPPQSLASEEDEDSARRDAGAALLSTLTLGSNDNNAPAPHRVATGQELKPALSTHHNLVLDKKSLQLSLLSLIQDERFLDLIHAQYLKVVHRRADRQQQETLTRK